MRYEYIVQKEDYKAKIIVRIDTYNLTELKYSIEDVQICSKGKRKYISQSYLIRDDYEYRSLPSFNEKGDFARKKYLTYITNEDIQAAIDYAYMQIKPDYDKVDFRVH